MIEDVRRVVILGPGGAGKSTLATRLGGAVDLPVVELDRRFWSTALEAMPAEEWRRVQTAMASQSEWIIDGDLGPYDVLEPRLMRADTVVVLDLPRWRCVWRSLRRSPERLDFWRWLWTWRKRSRPQLLAAIAESADHANVEVLRSPAAVERWLDEVRRIEEGLFSGGAG